MNLVLAAISRTDVADYVSALFTVYVILLLVRILLSWIPRLPYNPLLRSVVGFIHDVTDPYLRIFRRILPPVGAGGVAIDMSPIIGLILLFIAQAIVVNLIRPG